MVGGYCSAIFNALFGLSLNFWMAIGTRFLLGSFNCLLGTMKVSSLLTLGLCFFFIISDYEFKTFLGVCVRDIS